VFKNYDVNDGLQSNEFNWHAHHLSRSGEMFFGGINGLNSFFPAAIQDNPHVPPVVFTGFQIFNRPVSFKEKKSPLSAPIAAAEAITLSHEQNVFSFEFAALDYADPAKNRYRYKMENFDRDWRDNGTRRMVTYTNLSPGEYVLRVQGANNDGVWNQTGAAIRIIITPPWWRTWWAYTLYAALFVAIMHSLRRYEMSRQRLKHQVEIERLQAEQQQLETARLQELDRMKSRFFANISHEFRTPLTLILGPAEQLEEEVAGARAKEKLDTIRKNAQRLLRLINQLLDLSKLESGKMQLRAAPGDLVEFLRGLTFSFAALAERKRIALRFEARSEKLLAYFDRDKMEKIFSNLLSNAIKFTPEGGVVILDCGFEISDSAIPDLGLRHADSKDPAIQNPKSAIINVKDTGIGIPADKLARVFDRFYQVDTSSTREYEGTGIGLALVKELVELHHGTVSVASAVGKGSTFTVRLPLGKDHLAPEEVLEISEQYSVTSEQLSVISDQSPVTSNEQPATSDESERSGDPALAGQPALILLVEDHAEMRRFVRNELEPNYRVLEAGDGEAGWQQAIEAIPDLVISDVMMPKMNGFELCRRLKSDERTSHVPVILLTAKADQPDKLAGLETGADDYLAKPFDSQELLARVKNLIAPRRALRERFKSQVVLKPSEIAITSVDEAFLKKVMAAVEKHLAEEEFDVETLCREVGISRPQLHRKLTALTGRAANELIRTMRLQRAADLLAKNAGTIAEIAYMVGFSSQGYFTKCFQEQYGLTPREYAKKKLE
jgi:signal transduction histidine kinase/DNA-binding response OmpR family regulator